MQKTTMGFSWGRVAGGLPVFVNASLRNISIYHSAMVGNNTVEMARDWQTIKRDGLYLKRNQAKRKQIVFLREHGGAMVIGADFSGREAFRSRMFFNGKA